MERPRRSGVKRSTTVANNLVNGKKSNEVNGIGKKRKKEEVKKIVKEEQSKNDDGSDSESSSDEFFHVKSEPGPLKVKEDSKEDFDFSAIESNIFDGVTRLSDSESDSDFEEVDNKPPVLQAAVSKVQHEVAEADSILDLKDTLRTKQLVSKLQKKVINGLKTKVKEEDSNEGFKEKEGCKNSGRTNRNQNKSDKVSARPSKQGKKVSNIQANNKGDSDNEEYGEKSKSNGSVSKDEKEKVSTSKKGSSKAKSTPDSAKAQKSSKDKKKKNENFKSKNESSPKSADKKQALKSEVPSTSLKVEPGTSSRAIAKEIDDMDMNELLALGENLGLKPISQMGHSSDSEHSDGGEGWEEVNTEVVEEKKHVIPKEGVQITIEMPELIRRRRKNKEDLQAQMNRQLNRVRREFQILFHKISVLCWLAHGFYVNNVLNNEELLAVALSLIPNNHCLPAEKIDLKYVKNILDWFVKLVDYSEGFTHIDDDNDLPIKIESLQRQFSRRVAKSKRDLAFMFVCILRSIGIDARLVISLQPMPLKPQSGDLIPIKSTKQKQARGPVKKEKTPSPEKMRTPSPEKKLDKTIKEKPSTSKKAEPAFKTATKRKCEEPLKNGPSPRKTRSGVRKSYKEESVDTESEQDSKPLGRRADEKKKSEESNLSSKKKSQSEEDKEKLRKAAEKRNPTVRRSLVAKKKVEEEFHPKKCEPDSEDGDSDFTSESRRKVKKVSPKVEVKKEHSKPSSAGKKKGLKVLSSSEDEKHRSKLKKKMGCDYWIEVYVHKEESWIPVDVTRGKLNCPEEIKTRATQPITYVIAWNQNNTMKDVTRRYVSQYSQVTAKQRVDEKWWTKTMKPFKPKSNAMEKEEEGQLHMAQLNRPMPKSVAECKNHPLYVLKRHLLKFEAIYPPDSPSLGFVKGEPLYARQNVYTLHSREIWIKEAKTVKLGEKPYKIVKARPKYDRMSGNVITDLPLEIFGPWQVQDYEPPTAVDGKVPRNAYGNVELFKPSMLPKGCVHLQVPSLNRVAKKLQIDCAPAVVGFDYHCGGCHPTFDGFVVCEEYVDILMDAWNKEIDESAKRQKERDEKRIYGNWKRLIKGLFIREHLAYRYDFKDDDPDNIPADTKRNEIAAAEARLSQDTAPVHSVFPKLMAKIRQSNRGRRSAGPSTSGTRKSVTTRSKPKGKSVGRRRKGESSSEEESDAESTTSEEDVNMVLLSDADSGSEFDNVEDNDEEDG